MDLQALSAIRAQIYSYRRVSAPAGRLSPYNWVFRTIRLSTPIRRGAVPQMNILLQCPVRFKSEVSGWVH